MFMYIIMECLYKSFKVIYQKIFVKIKYKIFKLFSVNNEYNIGRRMENSISK